MQTLPFSNGKIPKVRKSECGHKIEIVGVRAIREIPKTHFRANVIPHLREEV